MLHFCIAKMGRHLKVSLSKGYNYTTTNLPLFNLGFDVGDSSWLLVVEPTPLTIDGWFTQKNHSFLKRKIIDSNPP